MKTASIPSLRVDPKLRQAAESALEEGETLSEFMEQSLRLNIERRNVQREFIARGLAARQAAHETGEYFAANVVLNELQQMLIQAEAKAKAKS